MTDFSTGIQKELSQSLKEKNISHRNRFKQLFKARYLELLPSLIFYKNAETVSVDFLKTEVALRNGYDIVIGETLSNKRHIQVIGYTNTTQSKENPVDLFSKNTLKHGAIQFLIPKTIQLPYYKEISYDDNCSSGNFVVLRNKTINYINDLEILDHYVDELAEIVLSRFSLSMQVKVNTLFMGEPNDEGMNDFIEDIYNGNPYIKASKLFDPKEQIFFMQNNGIAANFQELKREYQNKISELNNMLGINSLAVEKSSGVSDTEANSNAAYTTSNANIYLDARNNALNKLNKRFNLQLEAVYNDEVSSEFSELNRVEVEKEGESGGDNNTIQDNSNPTN